MSEEQLNSQPERSQKYFPFIIVIGLVAFAYLFYTLNQQANFGQQLGGALQIAKDVKQSNPFAPFSDQATKPVESYKYTAVKDGQTPFSLLKDNEDVDYEQYDFGVFVTAINGQKADSNYFWALYVEDEFAQLASDKIELNKGDQVEWRWEEVSSAFDEE